MSGHDSEETSSEKQESDTRDERDTGDENQQHSDADIKLSEEGRKEVHDMVEAYEDKPTVPLPGHTARYRARQSMSGLMRRATRNSATPRSAPSPRNPTRAWAPARRRLPRTGRRVPP